MVSEPKTGITVRKPQFKEITMKLKLNKKKMKTLSTDNNSIPAAMTPLVAGGQQDINSSYPSYRNCGGGGRVSMMEGPTCGRGYTCMDVY
jgi:hypothetical protein